MVSSAAAVEALVTLEVQRIAQPELVALIAKLRVPVRKEERIWNYGTAGQTLPCWIVLEHRESDTGVAYCAAGFGPTNPWGLLFLTRYPDMGMDSGWFPSLEQAVRDSMAWNGGDFPGRASV
jgi:hypothetical protein